MALNGGHVQGSLDLPSSPHARPDHVRDMPPLGAPVYDQTAVNSKPAPSIPPPIATKDTFYLETRRSPPPPNVEHAMDGPPPPYATESDDKAENPQETTTTKKRESFAEAGSSSTANPDLKFVLSTDGPLWRTFKETIDLRDKVVEKRIGLEVQEGHYMAQWRHTSIHLENFLTAATDMMSLLPPELVHRTDTKEKWARLQKSASFLRDLQNQGKSDVRDLTQWEGMLNGKEEQLYMLFRQWIAPPEIPGLTEDSDSDSASTVNFERLSESSGDPLEDAYYDKAGDLHLLREHIFNVDADQARRVIQREYAFKNGDYVPKPSEKHSYEHYIKDRQALINEYFETKQEVERLRDLCIQNGLEIETPDQPPFLDLSRSDDRPTHPEALQLFPKRSTVLSHDYYKTFGRVNRNNRVVEWRDNMLRATVEQQDISRARSPSRPPPSVGTRSLPSSPNTRKRLAPPYVLPHPLLLPAPAEPVIPDDNEPTNDEGIYTFERIQADNPPTRRYSEPDLREVHRIRQLEKRSLKQVDTARSENGVDTLTDPVENAADFQLPVWAYLASEPPKSQS